MNDTPEEIEWFDRYNDRARVVVYAAEAEARALGHRGVGSEHILLGMLHGGLASTVLDSFGVTHEGVKAFIRNGIERREVRTEQVDGSSPFTAGAREVFKLSRLEALQLGCNYLGTEHLLLGIVRRGEGGATRALLALDVDPPALRTATMDLVESIGP